MRLCNKRYQRHHDTLAVLVVYAAELVDDFRYVSVDTDCSFVDNFADAFAADVDNFVGIFVDIDAADDLEIFDVVVDDIGVVGWLHEFVF